MSGMPPIAVIAGGLATRMRPLTETIPKSLLAVDGEPFVAHQLRLFHRERLRRIVFCLGHLGAAIEEFVGDGARFGLQVQYAYDGERLLGTGGAVRRAIALLDDAFLVTYGDSYLDIEFGPVVAAFKQSGQPALMTVFHNAGKHDTSNIEFVDGRIVAYSKAPTPRMAHIDYGLAMLHAKAFDDAPADAPFDLGSIYTRLIERGEMVGYEVTHRFYEIGSPEGLSETEEYLRSQRLRGRR
jgi:NDP-sugar pyrophosphorylase family protein